MRFFEVPRYTDKVRNVQRIPSGPEAPQLQLKAGYMYACSLLADQTFSLQCGTDHICPRFRTLTAQLHPILKAKSGYTSKLFQIIANQGYIQAKRMGGNKQVITTNDLA